MRLAIGWEKRYTAFFDAVKAILNYPEINIYTEIKEFNKSESIFPSDIELNKVKLNDELVDQIFYEYHFKDLTKSK